MACRGGVAAAATPATRDAVAIYATLRGGVGGLPLPLPLPVPFPIDRRVAPPAVTPAAVVAVPVTIPRPRVGARRRVAVPVHLVGLVCDAAGEPRVRGVRHGGGAG